MEASPAFLPRWNCQRNERRSRKCGRRTRSCSPVSESSSDPLPSECNARSQEGFQQLGQGQFQSELCMAGRIRRVYGQCFGVRCRTELHCESRSASWQVFICRRIEGAAGQGWNRLSGEISVVRFWHPFRVRRVTGRLPEVCAALRPPATFEQPCGLQTGTRFAPGRCPRLLHFAPSALSISPNSAQRFFAVLPAVAILRAHFGSVH